MKAKKIMQIIVLSTHCAQAMLRVMALYQTQEYSDNILPTGFVLEAVSRHIFQQIPTWWWWCLLPSSHLKPTNVDYSSQVSPAELNTFPYRKRHAYGYCMTANNSRGMNSWGRQLACVDSWTAYGGLRFVYDLSVLSWGTLIYVDTFF